MDRTPSFFTTRSIINLSGLGVADPLPDLSTHHQFPPFGQQGQGQGLGRSPRNKSPTNSYSSTGSLAEEADMWGSTAAQPVAMSDAQSSRGGAKDSPLSASDQQQGGLDVDASEGGVCKTTTMARFYYKKTSGSQDGSYESLLAVGVDPAAAAATGGDEARR
jgi:hypothetical protein